MRWKRLIVIAVLMIAALLVTGYAILVSYDFNNYKPKIAQAVKEATGRELKIDGDIKVRLGLSPWVLVEDISFQNAPWGSRSELAKITCLKAQVALFSLIKGMVEVKRLILEKPDILLETDLSGKSNIEFQTGGQSRGAPPSLFLKGVKIEKGLLTYRDGESGKTYSLSLEKLNVAIPDGESPIEVHSQGALNGRSFEIEGTLGSMKALIDPMRKGPIELKARFGGAAIIAKGEIRDAFNVQGLAITVAAKGPSISEFIEVTGAVDMPDIGPFSLEASLIDSAEKLSIEKISLEAGSRELAEVTIKGAIEDLLTLHGVNLNFTARGKDLANLEKLTGRTMPIKGPFIVSGQVVNLSDKAYKFSDLNVVLGENNFKGSVDLNLAGKRPWVVAALSSQKLDLRPMLQRGDKSSHMADQKIEFGKKKDKVFPSGPLSLGALKVVNGNFKMRAGQILLPRVALDDFTAEMTLKDGRLMVNPIKSLIGGGSVEGRFDLHPQGESAALEMEMKIDKLALGPMMRKLGVEQTLEGTLDVKLNVNATGGSIAELMARLRGNTIMVMGEGRIDTKHIEFFGADLSSSIFRLINPFRHKTSYTEVNCFVSRFDIEDGLANCAAFVLDTKHTTVIGVGEIDLKNERLNISFKPSPKKGFGVSGVARISFSLHELTNPFKLGGTLANPSLAIDPTQTAITIGKLAGGLAFGPVGIAVVLADVSTGDKNPCLAAIEAAEKGVKVSPNGKRRGLR